MGLYYREGDVLFGPLQGFNDPYGNGGVEEWDGRSLTFPRPLSLNKIVSYANGILQINFARAHVEWSKRSLEEWEKAKGEVAKIAVR